MSMQAPGIAVRLFATSRHRWLLAVCILLVLAVYWPGLGGGFVFDDFSNIVANDKLNVSFASGWRAWLATAFSSPASELQRPLTMVTFALNVAMTGLDPYWMKLTNVAIHALNTFLVYGLAGRIVQATNAPLNGDSQARDRVALWIAAAWALNPINVTAVLYVVQRMESLSHTFVFAGLSLYLAGRARLLRGNGGWPLSLAGLVGCTAAGLLAKESAVLLPLYAFAIEWSLHDRAARDRRHERRMAGLFGLTLLLPAILGIAWLLPRFGAAAYVGRTFDLGTRLLTEPRVVLDYLHWTLLPTLGAMGLYHDDYVPSRGLFDPPATVLALVVLAALVTAAVLLRRRRPLAALGLAWFFCAQLLTATVVPLELMFEHRNYFASLGVCLVLADLCLLAPETPRNRRLGAYAAMGLLVLYAGVTTMRTSEWRNPLAFAAIEAERHPRSPRAAYELARDYVVLTGYRADSPYLQPAFIALERAMATPGASPLPDAAALVLAARTDRVVDAAWWEGMRRKLADNPIGPQETMALDSLVRCQIEGACQFARERMSGLFEAASRRPPSAEVLNIQGNYTLNILGRPDLALSLWRQASALKPTVPQYHVSVARLLLAMGRLDEARAEIAALRATGRLGQNDAQAMDLQRLADAAAGHAP
jgi:hypothetical protein